MIRTLLAGALSAAAARVAPKPSPVLPALGVGLSIVALFWIWILERDLHIAREATAGISRRVGELEEMHESISTRMRTLARRMGDTEESLALPNEGESLAAFSARAPSARFLVAGRILADRTEENGEWIRWSGHHGWYLHHGAPSRRLDKAGEPPPGWNIRPRPEPARNDPTSGT